MPDAAKISWLHRCWLTGRTREQHSPLRVPCWPVVISRVLHNRLRRKEELLAPENSLKQTGVSVHSRKLSQDLPGRSGRIRAAAQTTSLCKGVQEQSDLSLRDSQSCAHPQHESHAAAKAREGMASWHDSASDVSQALETLCKRRRNCAGSVTEVPLAVYSYSSYTHADGTCLNGRRLAAMLYNLNDISLYSATNVPKMSWTWSAALFQQFCTAWFANRHRFDRIGSFYHTVTSR